MSGSAFEHRDQERCGVAGEEMKSPRSRRMSSKCKCFDHGSCRQAWRQPMCTSSCSSASPLKVVVFPSPSLQLQMRKFKCLLAVGTRKRWAGGRKENQWGQEIINRKSRTLAETTLCCAGEMKNVLVPASRERSPLCSAEGSFIQLFTWSSLFGAKWGRDTEMHRTLAVALRSGAEVKILLLGPAHVPGRANWKIKMPYKYVKTICTNSHYGDVGSKTVSCGGSWKCILLHSAVVNNRFCSE